MSGTQTVALVVGGASASLRNFRGPLLLEMRRRGWIVAAAAGDHDEATVEWLGQQDISFERLPIARAGMNPVTDGAATLALLRMMRRLRPDVFFGYTIKPATYGLLAAAVAGVERRVAMITGLGFAFTEGDGFRRRLAGTVASVGLRTALGRSQHVIFQNPDDRDMLIERGLVRPNRAAVVPGSGVDLSHYVAAPLPMGPFTFLMIGRLLRDKGLNEFVGAARLVRQAHPDARFVLVGPFDSNPAGARPHEVANWVAEGVIEYLGELADVRPTIAQSHVYVLPSYREGLPRTVLEAMATGRAIITTDAPGCRETVLHGDNGLLVPVGDTQALAAACFRMISDPEFVRRAGQRSLEICRQRFEAGVVARQTLAIIAGDNE